MTAQEIIATLNHRGVQLIPDGTSLVAKPASRLTDADRQAIRACKAQLVALLTCENSSARQESRTAGDTVRNEPTLADRIEATWKPGEWIAYRDVGQLLTAKYAGVAMSGRVNLWLSDGALRSVVPEAVALDWAPDAAEIFERRLEVMLRVGVPEDVARVRAELCTREYFRRLRMLQ